MPDGGHQEARIEDIDGEFLDRRPDGQGQEAGFFQAITKGNKKKNRNNTIENSCPGHSFRSRLSRGALTFAGAANSR